jgi:hypothetical protein
MFSLSIEEASLAKTDELKTHQQPVRGEIRSATKFVTAPKKASATKAKTIASCKECRVEHAFHAWNEQQLTPSYNWEIDFSGWNIVPQKGKRAVIELITATISVPVGEWARLRLFTSLGTTPSNLDFVLTPQGQIGGMQILIATHSLRVYSDAEITFNVNRDNAQTVGNALICISGYLIDV